MRRVLAVIGAVLIIAAAMAVRSMIDDDPDGDRDAGGDGELVVVCDPDLRAACEAFSDEVEVRVEDSTVTSATLAGAGFEDVDGWITSSAWLEVAQSRASAAVDGAEALARAPVVLASDPDRADAIQSLCAGAPIWRCLTDAAEQSWGQLGGQSTWGPMRTGLPDADTALGLAVLSSVAVGYFGDADFAANDFTDLRGALTELAQASGSGDRNLLTTLVRRRGAYSAGGFVEPTVGGRTDVAILPAEPVVDAVVVLVDLRGGDSVDADGAQRALTDAGWQPASGAPPPTLKQGVMAALHSLWTETTG